MTGWLEHWLRIRSIDWRVEGPTNMRAYDRWLKTYRLEYIHFSFSFPHTCIEQPALNLETHSTVLYSNTALSVHFCLLTCGSHRWVDSVASHIQKHVDWCCAELGAHLFWFTEYGWQVEVLWSRWWGEDSECSHHMLLFPVSASETYTTWQAFSNTDEKFYRKSWTIF